MSKILLCIILFVVSVSLFASDLCINSNKKYDTTVESMKNVNRLDFTYNNKSDYALIDNTNKDSKTWVVFFHSFGGDAAEIFTSELIYPSWLNLINKEKFGLIAFNTYGNTWMAPSVADAIHNVLMGVKYKYKVNKFIFIGGSMGGSSVLIYTVRYPKDVYGAIAMCPVTNVEEQYKNTTERPNEFLYSDVIAKSFVEFYGDTKEKRQEAFDLNNATKNYKKFTMPLLIAHCADDPAISVDMVDKFAELMKNKKDFKYTRYDTGGHTRPSTEGFITSWDYYLKHFYK